MFIEKGQHTCPTCNTSLYLLARDFFAKLGGREGLIIVQCDAGDVNCNLIPCARHLLVEQRIILKEDFIQLGNDDLTFADVVMIIQLPRLVGGCQAFAGVQVGQWLSVHIDELRPPTGQIPAIQCYVDRSVSDLFEVAKVEEQQEDATPNKFDTVSVLRYCVQAAVARIDQESWRSLRSTRQLDLMLNLLSDARSDESGKTFFAL